MAAWIAKARFLRNFKIGTKLTIGSGILVLLTLLVVLLSYLGDAKATTKINITDEVRVPAALSSSRAQADLLRMLSDVRGYLALGELSYRTNYGEANETFKKDFAELKQLLADADPATQERLRKLDVAIGQWSQLPDRMFQFRDDQLAREPAYRILVTDVADHAGAVLGGVGKLIDAQAEREPTAANNQNLVEMADFQSSFAAAMSGLRVYVTTRNPAFREEYQASLSQNEADWQRLIDARETFSPSQQSLLDELAASREGFKTVARQAIQRLEGPDWRLDLFWLKTVAVPPANTMMSLLSQITEDQQNLLRQDLNEGRADLQTARKQTLAGGAVALMLGIALALILGNNIAGPVRRLTAVADHIRAGDLKAEARVESRDEIGTLAHTFNNMTGQLRQTLGEVTLQKRRADDLLDVVIPIGVSLASQTDFDRLLEDMLLQAKSFCRADAGTLYLRTEDGRLQYVIVRNDRLGLSMGGTSGQPITLPAIPLDDARCSLAARVALSGVSENVADAAGEAASDACGSEHEAGGATSVLAIPLKSSQGDVLGVLQLFDAKDPESGEIVAFDGNLQRMMESFSSLAVAALEAYIREQKLRQQIQQLRIEIDEAKRQKDVSEIVDTDFFQDLQEKARAVRKRRMAQEGDVVGTE